MTHDEMIAVIQAHKDGKRVQHARKLRSTDQWGDSLLEPSWNFAELDYRVKPEPREWWAIESESKRVYIYDDEVAALRLAEERKLRAFKVREVLE